MNTCPNCGHELEDPAAEFCPNCGYRLTATTAKPVAATEEQPGAAVSEKDPDFSEQDNASTDKDPATTTPDEASEPTATPVDHTNEDDDFASGDDEQDDDDDFDDDDEEPREPSKFELYVKDYFVDLNQNIRHPQIRHEAANFHGLINLGLIALFLSFAVSRFLGKAFGGVLSALSSSGLNLNVSSSPLPAWGYILIWIVLGFAVEILMLYLYQRLVLRENINFLAAINELFMPVGLGVYLSLLALILSLILAPSMALLIICSLPVLLVKIAFVGGLWTFSQAHPDQQRFYFIVVTLVLTVLLSAIVGRLVMSNLISQLNLPSMMSRLFGGNF